MIDTGERMIPTSHKEQMVYGEHIVRYTSVADLVEGQHVLDVACGSGYGSKILSNKAKSVVGVDISDESISYAKTVYPSSNIKYLVGEATKIPVENSEFDSVISFETIEHINNYKLFLKEVKRVLKDDGVFVVSTPNDDEFTEGNKFHLHEFRLTELNNLLKTEFRNVKIYFQGTWLYTALLSEKDFSSEWARPLETHKTLSQKPNKAVYFVAICSNSDLPKLHKTSAISEVWSAKELQKREQDHKRDKEELSSQLEELRKILNGIYSSKGWTFLTRLRRIRKHIPFL